SHPHRYKRALDDVLTDCREIEELVKPDVGQQVKARVKETVQSEHPSKLDHPRKPKHLPQRCDEQRQKQKNQSQHTRTACRKLGWIWAESMLVRVPPEQRERHQAINKDDEPRKLRVLHGHQKYFLKSMPAYRLAT